MSNNIKQIVFRNDGSINYIPMIGETLENAIKASILAAQYYKDYVFLTFNEIDLVIGSECKVVDIVEEWNKEREYQRRKYLNSPRAKELQRKNEAEKQAQREKLQDLKDNLPDFKDLYDVILWLDELEKCDMINSKGVVEIFEENGYYPNVNVGENFKSDDEENEARWLIGQALETIKTVGAIHPIYSKFSEEWKIKFGYKEHVEEVTLHEFKIYGLEMIERTATPVSKKSKSNRVYVPKDWTRVAIIKLE